MEARPGEEIYASGADGWDLSSSVSLEVQPGERRLVPVGLAVELPRGCYGKIAARSSWASKGVDVAGGVIDADFRGEIKVILVNNSSEVLQVNVGDRVGQLILEKIAKVNMIPTSSLSSTTRMNVNPTSSSSSTTRNEGGLEGGGVGVGEACDNFFRKRQTSSK